MAIKNEDVVSLIDAHYRRDNERFKKIVLCIASNNTKKTRGLILGSMAKNGLTDDVRGLLEPVALQMTHPATCPFDTQSALREIYKGHLHKQILFDHGLTPDYKMLFTGPPGTGKTRAAYLLGKKLDLPTYKLAFPGVIDSYLGSTIKALHKVFSFMQDSPGVYIFDEIDALATARARDDVGEMRRVVNYLLTAMDDMRGSSILIATTNSPELLDPALNRRFDRVIEFERPTGSEIDDLIHGFFRSKGRLDLSDGVKNRLKNRGGLSYADVVSTCSQVLKESLLVGLL